MLLILLLILESFIKNRIKLKIVINLTESPLEKSEMNEFLRSDQPTGKNRISRLLKFYIIPGWRDPEYTRKEFKIGEIKSKRRLFRRLLKPLTIIGILLILFIVFLAVFSPWLTIYPIEELSNGYHAPFDLYSPPSPLHPLGTTNYGYDVYGRIIWGARTAVTAAAIPALISTLGGLVVGTISAYFGGKVDSIIMRFSDFWFALPQFIIIIIISPMMGQDLYNLLLLFGIFGIPGSARWIRTLVLQVRHNTYVKAAIAGGAVKFKVMFKHILPNAISPVIISFFGSMGGAVLAFAGIAFLNLGDQKVADWGTDINYGMGHLLAPWTIVWPGLFLSLTVIGFMLIGDGLRDALDPRLHL
ncbi:hypothetical protein LCGC14_0320700 [marine sediment metagenome]|uniref:ABC transmembrane type-1 domain-containing protein n=1 Tax=marine sediment metagenome TaxID=412755 RepID=A0A0F9WRF4_9ZZZZ